MALFPKKKKVTNNSPDAILAAIYKQISGMVSQANIINSITDYLIKRNKYNNVREFSSARGNIQKEIKADTMTWKVFCRSLEILNIKKIVITFDVTWHNEKTTKHFQVVNFDNNLNADKDDLDDPGSDFT